MAKYVVSVLILAAGIVWLTLGAPVIGGPGLLESELPHDFTRNPDAYCDESNPDCQSLIAAARNEVRPTPLPDDPRVRDVFLANDLIETLTSAGQEGLDYWIKVDGWRELEHGTAGATAFIFFEDPVSFEADVSYSISPCAPHSREGYVPRDHPCKDDSYKFEMQHRAFDDVYQLRANIDPNSGLVFDIIESRFDAETIQRMKAEAASTDEN